MLEAWECGAWTPVVSYAPDNPAKVATYEDNKTALTMYIENKPLDEIRKETGLAPMQVRRLARRAAARHPLTKERYGWCVCVPDFRIDVGASEPDDEPAAQEGSSIASDAMKRSESNTRSGDFRRFLEAHPNVLEFLLLAILKGKLGRTAPVTNPSLTDIHAEFKRRCRADKVTDDQYPLCTVNQAFESLRRFRARVLAAHLEDAAMVLGGKPMLATLALTANRGSATTVTPVVLPMARFEQDTWSVDALLGVMERVSPEMAKLLAPLRLQLLAMVDRGSEAVCAFELFAEDAAAAQSRLLCSTFAPHVRRRIRAFDYPAGPCFPSEIQALEWCRPRQLAMDRIAYQVQLRVDSACRTLDITPDFSDKKQPVDRIGVEGLFGVLTRVVKHWPIATGNSSVSSFRREPEKHASKFLMALAVDFFECFFAVYNTMERPNGTSRIGGLLAAIEDGSAYVKPTTPCLRALVPVLLAPAFSVRINHPPETGPYVECRYARYFPQDASARETLTAVSARGTPNLRLHILDDASKGVLTEVRSGVEVELCRLKVLDRTWGRQHKLLERESVKSIRKRYRVRVTSATTAAGYLLQVMQVHGHQALGVGTRREAQRRIAQLTLETHGDGVLVTDADIEERTDDVVDGSGVAPGQDNTADGQGRGQRGGDDEFQAFDE